MKTLTNIEVPTGNILIVEGDKGKLECLSIGDYGQSANVKAQFIGLNKDIEGVPNGKCKIGRASCRVRVCQYV